MRRGAGTTAFAPVVDSAAIAPTEPAAPAIGASGTRGAAEADAASATGGTPAAGGLTATFSSRAPGATGGFATPAGGGATTIIGRVATTAPAGALATIGPEGGREAMAGVAGGAATIGGAERGCGTILRGSGLAGVAAAGFAATTGAAGCATGASGLASATTVAFAVPRGWRASSSSSFFFASSAFITSPGLEMFDRSILGTMASAPWRPDAVPACVVCRDARAKCARTFSASSSSSELECVLPAATPTSGRTSRIARDFTSSSFARSLIRTLLIRLFSMCAAKWPLKIYRSPMASFRFLVRCQNIRCRAPAFSATLRTLLAAIFRFRYAFRFFDDFGGVFRLGLFRFNLYRLFAPDRRLSIIQ